MLMLFLPPSCKRSQMRTKCKCGNASSVGRHLATSQIWRTMWKQIMWKAWRIPVQNVTKYPNQEQDWESTWKLFTIWVVSTSSKVPTSISVDNIYVKNTHLQNKVIYSLICCYFFYNSLFLFSFFLGRVVGHEAKKSYGWHGSIL